MDDSRPDRLSFNSGLVVLDARTRQLDDELPVLGEAGEHPAAHLQATLAEADPLSRDA